METLQEILIDGLKKYGAELIGAGLFTLSLWGWRHYYYKVIYYIAYAALGIGVILMFYKYFSVSVVVMLVLVRKFRCCCSYSGDGKQIHSTRA